MNANEIKELVAAKIAGQGNQVDIGGALSEVLNAIIDAIENIPTPTPPQPIAIDILDSTFSGLTKEEAARSLGISTARLDSLMDGNIPIVRGADSTTSLVIVSANGETGGTVFNRIDLFCSPGDGDPLSPWAYIENDGGSWSFLEI